jgi:hypothetical protein
MALGTLKVSVYDAGGWLVLRAVADADQLYEYLLLPSTLVCSRDSLSSADAMAGRIGLLRHLGRPR